MARVHKPKTSCACGSRPSRRPETPGTVLPRRAPCWFVPPWAEREVPALPLRQHPCLA